MTAVPKGRVDKIPGRDYSRRLGRFVDEDILKFEFQQFRFVRSVVCLVGEVIFLVLVVLFCEGYSIV